MRHHIPLGTALLPLALLFLLFSCNNKPGTQGAWLLDDDVRFAVDETFRPIVGDLSDTFGLSHPESGMKPVYVSEDSALRLLVSDSLRCCIATRQLSEN